MVELSTLQDGVEKPQRGPSHPLQGQHRGWAAKVPHQPQGQDPCPTMGVPKVPPRKAPILLHHTMTGSAAAARVLPRGGLGEDSGR